MKKITKLWGLLLIAPALLSFSQGETPSAADRDEVHRFIRNSWDKTVRFNTEDEGTRIGLPYRYTVPSISGAFQEMYLLGHLFHRRGADPRRACRPGPEQRREHALHGRPFR